MPLTRVRLLAACVGAALGVAGRGVPFATAAAILRGPPAGRCGMEEVLECVVRDFGPVVMEVARLAAATVAIAGASAMLGMAATVLGLVLRHHVVSAVLVGGGVMLTMPALWLAGTFVASMAT